MPTAATADAAPCCVIERNLERSRFQLRTCLRRSRRAGPVQRRTCMTVDETVVADILKTAATAQELSLAWTWIHADEALTNQGRPYPSGPPPNSWASSNPSNAMSSPDGCHVVRK